MSILVMPAVLSTNLRSRPTPSFDVDRGVPVETMSMICTIIPRLGPTRALLFWAPGRRLLVNLGAALVLFALGGQAAAVEVASDEIVLPPERREVSSPSGRFVLVLAAVDGWKTPRAVAELYRVRSGHRQLAWRRDLPHHHGPRRALVSGRGEVLLVDEWINVTSPHALTLIDQHDRTVARYTADEVFAALGVSLGEISNRARAGPWITDGPFLSIDGEFGLIPAGGRTLEIRLADGSLAVLN